MGGIVGLACSVKGSDSQPPLLRDSDEAPTQAAYLRASAGCWAFIDCQRFGARPCSFERDPLGYILCCSDSLADLLQHFSGCHIAVAGE